MTHHKKKRNREKRTDWWKIGALAALFALVGYTTYYAWGETTDMIAEKEWVARIADYLEGAKVGQIIPRWLPADLADMNKEQTIAEIRVYEARERVMSRWCFMLINRQGKILAIISHRLRLSRQ